MKVLVTGGAGYIGWTTAKTLEWKTELSLDEAIGSRLAWAEKRHEVLGYE